MFLLVFISVILWVCGYSTPATSSVCNIKHYGAKGDNKTDDTQAIQHAFNGCPTGSVVFPPGAYVSKPISIPTGGKNLRVEFQQGSHLVLWPHISTYPNHTMFLTGDNLSNITIVGPGQIDGGGFRWWPYKTKIFRPTLIQITNSKGVTIENMTLLNAPSFHMHIINAEHVRVSGLTIEAGCGYEYAPNTDGIHLDNVKHAYVGNSRVRNGDDCIPMGGNTEDVLVENMYCECSQNAGVPIIWSNGGTLQRVVFRNITAVNSEHAAGIKSLKQYTGIVRDITFENIRFDKVRGPAVYINVFFQDMAEPPVGIMQVMNITYKDIKGTNTNDPGKFMCSKGKPCTGLSMDGLSVTGTGKAFRCENAYGYYKDANPPPCWKAP